MAVLEVRIGGQIHSHVIELVQGETVPVPFYLYRDGIGLSLTGATVTFSALWMGEALGLQHTEDQPTAWTDTSTVAIDEFTCTPDADQSANAGKGTFTPTTAMYTAAPPGKYRYQFKAVSL